MNDKARHIRERFSDKKPSLDFLMAEDPEFRTLCEDYDACVNALRYWTQSEAPEAKTRVNEYHALVRDLEEEVTQALTRINRK